jgi:hypothetical protein
MGKGKTTQKKGKRGGKVSHVNNLKKVTGDLSEERVNILLFGFPNDYNSPAIKEDISTPEDEGGSHGDVVQKKRHMALQTKHFSHMLEERAASPVVSPRYCLR